MTNPIKILLLNIYFWIPLITLGQIPISGTDALSFTIVGQSDTIEFIKIDQQLNTRKPTIIFFQGSLPIPLIIKSSSEAAFIPSLNFNYEEVCKKFNLIVIGMPHIPTMVSEDSLSNHFAYITDKSDPHSFPKAYLEDDYLENYVERGNSVINFLMLQDWVAADSIYIVGHSQGARIATKIAVQSKNIAALGFLAGDPLGRVTQPIRAIRLKQRKGELTPIEAQNKIDDIYKKWEAINAPSEEIKQSSIVSFSEPLVNDLTQTKLPVYIAYGTEDLNAEYCDLLPIYFIRNQKHNYRLVAYPGLEHNFMELDSLGNPNPEKFHWNDVFMGFIDWLEGQ